MADTQATFLATLIDEWVRGGVTDVVVAPGNRSTLMSALMVSDGRLRVHVMVDERSASYFALGLGLATGRPAVFWCTSGTATAEAHAAVIEADQAGVPLLVCTADRPPEARHVRDWQSIDQDHLYGRSPRWFLDPGVADLASASTWRSIAARAVLETMNHPNGPGPVHLNLPIREPWSLEVGDTPAGRSDGAPWHVQTKRITAVRAEDIAVVTDLAGKRGVIIAGGGDLDPDAVHGLAAALGWPVLAEARSGCRTWAATAIALTDEIVRVESLAYELRPEVVVRLGTPGLSKPVAQWLKASAAVEILVDPFDRWVGAAADVQTIVAADPVLFCEEVTRHTGACDVPAGWLEQWQDAEGRVETALATVFGNDALTEPAISRAVAGATKEGDVLFVAPSMPVRDIESYAPKRSSLPVLANRGASGMDGVISTAAGVAAASGHTTLLTGDLTFLYDLNALWVIRGAAVPVSLTVVVVDNGGGGIFSLLPQLSAINEATFEKVVGTPQSVDIERVVEAFDIDLVRPATLSELHDAVAEPSTGMRVIYLKTDRKSNVTDHQTLHAAVAAEFAHLLAQARAATI